MNESLSINIDEKLQDVSHNEPISMMEISPNEKDLVTYSEDDTINMDEKSHDEPQDKPQDKPHNGKNMMEISPNGKYLVTYSKENQTIVGWNVEYVKKDDDMKEGKDELVKITKDDTITVIEENKDKSVKVTKDGNVTIIEESAVKVINDKTVEVDDGRIIRHMCVSDKKILAYVYDDDIGKYCIKSVMIILFFNL